MMGALQTIYDRLPFLTDQPECSTCRRCEEAVGLVYLLSNEPSRVIARGGLVSITSEGVAYVRRSTTGFCSCFDSERNSCRIYSDRPLCCRLYPLDLIAIEGEIWWVLHENCPITDRLQREHQSDLISVALTNVERELTDNQLQEWLTQDRTSKRVEAFSTRPNNVIKLRRFGEGRFFNLE